MPRILARKEVFGFALLRGMWAIIQIAAPGNSEILPLDTVSPGMVRDSHASTPRAACQQKKSVIISLDFRLARPRRPVIIDQAGGVVKWYYYLRKNPHLKQQTSRGIVHAIHLLIILDPIRPIDVAASLAAEILIRLPVSYYVRRRLILATICGHH